MDPQVRAAILTSQWSACVPRMTWTEERERELFEACHGARVLRRGNGRLDFEAWGYDWQIILEGRGGAA